MNQSKSRHSRNARPQAQAPKPQPAAPRTRKRNWEKAVPLLLALVLGGLSYGFLLSGQADMLFRAQELSLFLPNGQFFNEQMVVPGGAATYAAAWLTQYLYHPALGLALLVVLWWAIFALVLWIFRLPRRWALCAWVAPLTLMAITTEPGYWIYHLKTVGYPFLATVGFLGTLLLLAAYRTCGRQARWAVIPLALIVGYPLFGFYALLAGLYMIVLSLREEPQARVRWLQAAVAVVCIALVPVAYYYVYNQQSLAYIYVRMLPFTYIPFHVDAAQYIPYALLVLSPLLFFALGEKGESGTALRKRLSTRYWACIQVVAVVVMVAFAKHFWYDDPNFRAELYMHRAAWEQRWDDIVERSYMEPQEPTRLMVLFRNLALLRLGRGGDEMFLFDQGGARPNAAFNERMLQVGGKMIYLNYAKFNFCYRWALEDAVEYGWKIDYLRYMGQCALFSGEKEVARKYFLTLSKTRYYADWAQKQLYLLDHPAELAQTEEYKNIMPLYIYNDQLDADQNLAELYLLNSFSRTWGDNALYQEVSMMCTLIMKDIPRFWPRFFSYAATHQSIPRYYQEAAMLYAFLERQYDPNQLPIDDEIKQRFARFQQATAQSNRYTEEQLKTMLRPEFGDTFWYFYFLVRNVQTN
ncbi:MAG: DUF6057 family protein [Bacteroidaceae bacterium]|jgi:hypothetical protein